ncbi:MAG: diaminopimelate epimerase [Bacteroidales bacterium]|nr:diaminopimelate epimerase [Bacteroidales bacterium]
MLYKFTGAGNNFVVLDGRGCDVNEYRNTARISQLCREHHTDGLMILGEGHDCDFSMEFYNPDGSGGMMCGNGGRCIVAFADMLGIKPAAGAEYRFLAPDGIHVATILSSVISSAPTVISSEVEKSLWTVRLKMIDVEGITPVKDGYFLNTGTRHFVKFVDDVNAVDVEEEGKRLRWDPVFQPEGTNVNFVQIAPDGLHVRTFEKGVEGETLACGTGLTASAVVYGSPTNLQCRRGDWLRVDFTKNGTGAKDVFLTGPAECVSII